MPRDLQAIRRVLWVTLILNLGVAVAKLVYGLRHSLLAMSADGIHSFLDGGGNIVGLVAVSAASRPPDADHPYGHRKLETFASLSIGGLLFLASWEILKAAWHRLVEGGTPDPGPGGLLVIGATMLVNFGVSTWEKREGQRLGSEILVADSIHTRSDLVTSASVLLAMVVGWLGWHGADVVVTLGIVAWVLRLAWQVVRPAFATLADEARLDQAEIHALASGVDGVRDVHRIRSRGHLDQVFVDLHVQVNPSATVEHAHAIAHAVEETIRERYPEVVDVLAHVEPHGDPVEGLDGTASAAP